MRLNKRNLEPIGFSSGLMTSATSLTLHWRPKGSVLQWADGIHDRLGVWKLTPAQMRKFKAGKLGMTPPGFCSPMRRGNLEEGYEILLEGRPRNRKHLEKIFTDYMDR